MGPVSREQVERMRLLSEQGQSLEAIADALGIHKATVSRWKAKGFVYARKSPKSKERVKRQPSRWAKYAAWNNRRGSLRAGDGGRAYVGKGK